MKHSKHQIARFLLEKVLRFRVDYTVPEGARNCVLAFAPHTSIWDFAVGKLVMIVMDLNTKVMVKKEAFFFPLSLLLKSMGGFPIDRKHASTLPEQVAKVLHENKDVTLLICPEGTRARTERWKRGFYLIAQKAEVPIFLSYIDWKEKRAGIGVKLEMTGNFERDMQQIADFYRGMQGLHKGQFNFE